MRLRSGSAALAADSRDGVRRSPRVAGAGTLLFTCVSPAFFEPEMESIASLRPLTALDVSRWVSS